MQGVNSSGVPRILSQGGNRNSSIQFLPHNDPSRLWQVRYRDRYYTAADELVASIPLDELSSVIAELRDWLDAYPPVLKPLARSIIEDLEQRRISSLVSPETMQNDEVPLREGVLDTPSPGAAVSPQLPMRETETIGTFARRKGLTVAQLEEAVQHWKAAHSEIAARATEQVFRNLPEGLARPYSKDQVPDEVLTPENVATAYRIQNAVKRRKPEAELISPSDRYLAGRIVRAHEQRPGNG